MSKLYIMVGIPGSGKSTYAKKIDGVICSSDQIRKELYGSEAILGSYSKVFGILDEMVKNVLISGENAIYDATNLSKRGRRSLIYRFQEYAEEIIIIYICTSLKTALKRNNRRKRKVPENIIKEMYYNKLEEPDNFEADKVIYIDTE